jgi:hypothetical protein
MSAADMLGVRTDTPTVTPLGAHPAVAANDESVSHRDHATLAEHYRRSRATTKQKNFAASLGIEFPDDIDKGTISELIDAALAG